MEAKENKLKFIVDCDAVGKSRPRFSTRNGRVFAYTPKKTSVQESLIQREFLNQCGMGMSDYSGNVAVDILVGYRIPRSKSKKDKAKMLTDCFSVRTKPDIDNVVKLILDALNGYAFKDDSQIIRISAMKQWMTNPQTTVELHYEDIRE